MKQVILLEYVFDCDMKEFQSFCRFSGVNITVFIAYSILYANFMQTLSFQYLERTKRTHIYFRKNGLKM